MPLNHEDPIVITQFPCSPALGDRGTSDAPSYPDVLSEGVKAPEGVESRPIPEGSSLLAITKALYALEAALIEAAGEVSPDIEQALSAATIMKERKVDAYAAILARLESIKKERSDEAELHAKISNAASRTMEYLKDNLKHAMLALDVTELEGDRSRFKLSRSAPKIDIDLERLPSGYVNKVVTYTPNRELIKEDLKAGKEVVGAMLVEVYALRKSVKKPKELK